jgi:DNA-directed RNA polymerase specialized sigma24 family protein
MDSGKSLEAFARMLVDKKYIDLSRKVKKEAELEISTEATICEDMTILDTIASTSVVNPEDSVVENSSLERMLAKVPTDYDIETKAVHKAEILLTGNETIDAVLVREAAEAMPAEAKKSTRFSTDKDGNQVARIVGKYPVKIRLRDITEWTFQGMTMQEIAKYLGVATKEVEGVFENGREDLQGAFALAFGRVGKDFVWA